MAFDRCEIKGLLTCLLSEALILSSILVCGWKNQIRDEYTRRNVELVDENERLSMENKRVKEELDQGTCAKLQEYNARTAELERNLAFVKHRRDGLRAKFEYARDMRVTFELLFVRDGYFTFDNLSSLTISDAISLIESMCTG